MVDTKQLIEKVIDALIKAANRDNELIEFSKDITKGETRIAYFQIVDLDKKYWIGFDGQHIVKIADGSNIKPTTIFRLTSDTLLAIILNKIEPIDAIYLGFIEIDGDYWMRDLALFEKGLEKFKDRYFKMFKV